MYLISGTSSGLGKFLLEHLDGTAISRNNNISMANLSKSPYEAIIHCAFNANRGMSSANIQQYVNDNLTLTQKLLTIPHKKFIFISSSDVYPRNERLWKEEDDFLVDNIENSYGVNKLMAEAIIKNTTDNYLILRPTALLGIHSRMNSLMKILFEDDIKLTLDPASQFNYILHEDILQFIKISMCNDARGIFNLAANDNVTLGEVASSFNRQVNFGPYVYTVANVCNEKAKKIHDVFSRSSLDNVNRFISLMEASDVKRCG